jgi:hypothetical protein
MHLLPFHACWLGTVNSSIQLNSAEKSRGRSYITVQYTESVRRDGIFIFGDVRVCSGGEGCAVTVMHLWW